jgi:hypothetical protein
MYVLLMQALHKVDDKIVEKLDLHGAQQGLI